jgi:hypothetical protein
MQNYQRTGERYVQGQNKTLGGQTKEIAKARIEYSQRPE